MIKIDPIIAVKDVVKSSKWYQSVFRLRSIHGGNEFDILADKNGDVLLCLHKWGEHDHPTMQSSNMQGGNGMILYFRTDNIEQIRENLRTINNEVEQEIELSPNSRRKEFSFRDLDGYYITIAEYHEYEA
ncbi:glyoxalase [Aureibaculum sp. 2210JD6-5]|uniref:VOC family protein n=1 Tax=Aureibaculum sp. 2210JD6-5 TaxID=3103957 RepID=UPI002AACFBF0|nr:VOC family protein [Aureibaculum sp. 2210JD6-5]MDY7396671.1 glyoxalase [Aureibaculum sp. 2210JD6-5]